MLARKTRSLITIKVIVSGGFASKNALVACVKKCYFRYKKSLAHISEMIVRQGQVAFKGRGRGQVFRKWLSGYLGKKTRL